MMKLILTFVLILAFSAVNGGIADSGRCVKVSHAFVYRPSFNDYFHHLTFSQFRERIDINGFEKFLPSEYSAELIQTTPVANIYSFGRRINRCSEGLIELNLSAGFIAGKAMGIHLKPATYKRGDTLLGISSNLNAEMRELLLGARVLFFAKEVYRFRVFIGANIWSSAMVFNRGYIVTTEDKYYDFKNHRTIHKGDLRLKRNYSLHASMPAGIGVRLWKGLSLIGEVELGIGYSKFQSAPRILKTFASAGFGVRYELDEQGSVKYHHPIRSPRFSLRMSTGLHFFNDRRYTEKDYYSILINQDSVPGKLRDYIQSSHRYAAKVFNLSFGAFLPLKNNPRLIELAVSGGYMYGKKFYSRYSFLKEGPEDSIYAVEYHSRRDYLLLGGAITFNFLSRKKANVFLGLRYQYALSVFASSVRDTSALKVYYPSEGGSNYRGNGAEGPYTRKSFRNGSNALPSYQVNYIIPLGVSIKTGEFVSVNFAFLYGFGFEKIQYHAAERRTLVGMEFNLAYEF